jgi:Flp pilus assembly protein TadD
MINKIYKIKVLIAIFLVLVFSGCSNYENAKNIKKYQTTDISPEQIASDGINFILKKDYVGASKRFNAALKLTPSNSKIHFLNGLSYHLSSSEGDESKRALAEQGYDLSLKFDKSNWLVYYYKGLLKLDAKEFDKAKENFAEALLLNSNDPDLLYHMGFAAYYTQDIATARAVFFQLNKNEPESARSIEALAMVSAANNEPENAKNYISTLKSQNNTSTDRVKLLIKRLNDWESYHSKSKNKETINTEKSIESINKKSDPEYVIDNSTDSYDFEEDQTDMITLDAVFISTEEVISSSRGTNLLNGLSVQFGNGDGDSSFTRTRENDSGDRTVIETSLITIPAINYSLNIANSFGNRNEILARPSLVATSGSQSSFFAGIEVEAGIVSEKGEVTIEKEVGVSLEITPEIQDDGRIALEIIASRTFLKPPSSNVKFDFAVELSKTQVSANVVVNEGDTLILSGLSEKEISSTRDGVPLLQDIPALQYIFSNERDYKLQKSILILITARKADYIYKKQSQNNEQVSSKVSSKAMKELRARYLDWFKPYPNTASVFEFMQGNALYREFRTGDVKMEKWQGSQNLSQRLSEARKFLYY